MNCIYYKDKEGLLFKGQEHIFPAGLGGIKKLPKDYVSSDANNYFSKLENHLMHGSLIMIQRSLFGPSKRKDKKEGKKIITVMENTNEDGGSKIELGYIKEGTPYVIPQVYIGKGHMNFIASPEEGVAAINSFIEKLSSEPKCFIRKTSEKIGEKNVIIGYSQGTIYVAHNPKNNYPDDVIGTLIKKAVELYNADNPIWYGKGQVKVENKLSETMNDYRIFGKIAFNVLADRKGKNYVLNEDFDKYRNWIMGNDDPDYKGFLPSLQKMDNLDKIFPEQCHWCVIFNFQGDLCAVVSLYSTFQRSMVIAKNRGGDISFMDGMICDWKNNKEYSLIDYIVSEMPGRLLL